VLTVEVNGEPAAFAFSALTEQVVIEAEIGGEPVVAFWQSGVVSALDKGFIIGRRNVGSAGAFAPFAAGERLTFENRDGAIVDYLPEHMERARAGSRWADGRRAVGADLLREPLLVRLGGVHAGDARHPGERRERVLRGRAQQMEYN